MVMILKGEGLVTHAKDNVHSQIGKEICGSHVLRVWEGISRYINEEMCNGHGVIIPGLALFTYKVKRSEISHKSQIVKKIPVILLSEQLINMYSLKSTRPAFNLDLPDTKINLSAIALDVGLPRKIVERCIEEVIAALRRGLVSDKHVELHFHMVGRIIIHCRKVYQFFHPDYIALHLFNCEVVQHSLCPTN